MNNRLRRSAYLRSFFCFVRSVALRSDGLEEPIGRAGTLQIKSSSSELELLNLTSFDR